MDKEIELEGGEEEVVEHIEWVDDEQLTAFSTLLFLREDESGVTRYFIIFILKEQRKQTNFGLYYGNWLNNFHFEINSFILLKKGG